MVVVIDPSYEYPDEDEDGCLASGDQDWLDDDRVDAVGRCQPPSGVVSISLGLEYDGPVTVRWVSMPYRCWQASSTMHGKL